MNKCACSNFVGSPKSPTRCNLVGNMYQNFEHYKCLNLKMVDESGIPILEFRWNDLFLRKYENSNYFEFTNKVMKISYTLIHGSDPPRPCKDVSWKQKMALVITYTFLARFPWCSMQTCLFFYFGLLLHGVSAWISIASFHFRALFLIFSLPGLRFRSPLRWFRWWSSSLEQSSRSRVGTYSYRGAYQLETGIHGEIRYISLV